MRLMRLSLRRPSPLHSLMISFGLSTWTFLTGAFRSTIQPGSVRTAVAVTGSPTALESHLERVCALFAACSSPYVSVPQGQRRQEPSNSTRYSFPRESLTGLRHVFVSIENTPGGPTTTWSIL